MTLAAATTDLADIVLPAATLVVTALVGAAAVWIAYATGFPRQRLLYHVSKVTPLVNAPQSSIKDVEVQYRHEEIPSPHLLKIQIVSRGRRDIPSSAFDGAQPLRLDFGTPIRDILEVTQVAPKAEIAGSLKVNIDRTALHIGPCLIGKRQMIVVSLLIEGSRIRTICRTPLADINVRKRRTLPSSVNANFAFGASAAFAVASMAFIVLGVLSGIGLNVSGTTIAEVSSTPTISGLASAINSEILGVTEGTYFMLVTFGSILAIVMAAIGIGLRRSERSPWWF